MKKKFDLFYLNKRHEELGTWEDVAAEFSVDKRTLQRYRKEAEFVTILEGMRPLSKNLHDWAKNLNINFDKLCNLIKRYGLEDESIPLTPRDPKLESPRIISQQSFLDYNKKIKAKCPPSIGYDEVSFKFRDRQIIIPFGDFHLGNEQTDYLQWAKDVVYIAEIPNLQTIWVGDYTDNFTARGFRAGIYEQVMKVSEAKAEVKNAIVIMKDKVLGILNGCHDRWMKRDEGFDISKYLAEHAPKSYWMGNRGFFNLKIGDIDYRISACHKTKRKSTDNMGHGGKMQFRNLIPYNKDVDIFFTAHHHRPHIEAQWIRGKMVYVIQCSAYKRSDDFIEGEGIPPAPIRLPCVLLDNKVKEIILFEDLRTAVKYL